jgi:putative membrane protein
MRFFLRWVITAIAVAAAAWITPGITHVGNWVSAAIVTAIVLGLINALIRPIMKLFSCGLIVVTLGFFTLVVNALCLWLASYISVEWFSNGFRIESFFSAFLASIIISVVSFLLSFLLPDKGKKKEKAEKSVAKIKKPSAK